MRLLLRLTALIEAATGLGFVVRPTLIVRLLLGGELLGAGIPLGRVAGMALLALGVACWLASYDPQSYAARAIVSAMALYNLGATVILGLAGVRAQSIGIALWPAVIIHAVMTIWCVSQLRHPAGRNET